MSGHGAQRLLRRYFGSTPAGCRPRGQPVMLNSPVSTNPFSSARQGVGAAGAGTVTGVRDYRDHCGFAGCEFSGPARRRADLADDRKPLACSL
jgi:hypothetical protein